ncbi:MAG: indole-3-glycerol phosphate synthase TrpC [Anaerolineales bacterium]|nr:indole-3-glycerol phosphate synthase TrpC [Anaerolineales bacterium]
MNQTANILEQIFDHKRDEIAKRKARVSFATMRRQAEAQNRPLDFLSALQQTKPAVIAEVKRASPSKGEFGLKVSALELAQLYFANGATAISVLTDERYFQGGLEDLQSITKLPKRVPILQKDFLYDPYQVYEARAYGADAVLLIASYLEFGRMQEMHDCATELGMSALVEAHTADEVEKALRLQGLKIIGINNRDLRTFQVSLNTCLELRSLVPTDILFVAESGIQTADDVRRLLANEISAILVGEALVRSENPAQKLKELLLREDED